jgi:hypothetical protein
VNDASQANQGRIVAEVEVVDKDFEGAFAISMGEPGARGIKGPTIQLCRGGQYLFGGDIDDLGVGSMNRRISQGQAILSVLGRARVTHFT